jgi:glycerate kinase
MLQEPMPDQIQVLIAPNSMKGSLDAFRFAEIIAGAFQSVSPRFKTICKPVADGGDFTADILIKEMGLAHREIQVHDPLGRMVKATYGLGNKLAIIEMANASGMKLLDDDELNPMKTSSKGTGDMIVDAVGNGAKTIWLGVGGSATIDGGMGLLEALGVMFYDREGERLSASGAAVGQIDNWDDSALLNYRDIEIKVICDVENPLLGKSGAVEVFGKQKGASAEMMPVLEQNLARFSVLIQQKKEKALAEVEGMGAAGGINLALVGFLDAQIVSGADFVLDMIGFDKELEMAQLVITGEGKIDGQTANNKAPFAVLKRARKKNIPVVAIGGKVTPEGAALFDHVYSLMNDEVDLQTAIRQAPELVSERAKQAAKEFLGRY